MSKSALLVSVILTKEESALHFMLMERLYSVYIIASPSDVLYIGVTSNLIRRIQEHREGKMEGFSKKYGCNRLLYYESGKYIYDAITREKELKGGIRKKKIELIESMNPDWRDLYEDMLS